MQHLRRCSWIYRILAIQLQRKNACMGGCLEGYVRPPLVVTLPEQVKRPSKRRSNRGLWGQPIPVLNSQGHRSFSMFLQKPGSSSLNNDNFPFENHALAHWHKQRQQWIGLQKPQPQQRQELVLRWGATYEELLGTSRPFTEPVPLTEMVDFLIDVWEQEDLYG